MASTYTLNNGIELIGTGEQSGTWGDTTNTNLSLLDTALDGQVTVTLSTAGTSGSPNALPISDGSASDGRNRMIIFADGGDLGGTAYVQLTPNDAEKIIYIRNDLSGSRSILFFQGTYNASNDYEVPAGTTAVIYFDGGGTGAVAANVFNNAYFDSLRLGSVSVTAIIDDDTMATASATNIATSESIKAYVDTQVGANNELSEVLANGNTSGGNNIQMTTTDELQFRDTALKISSSADGQLDIDADTEIEIVAPTVDIDASTAMTIDTAALTVTGAVDLNTSLNVDGTVTSDGLTVDGNLSVDGGTIKLDGNYPNGTGNVALGNQAGDALASGGNYNVAVGSAALSAVITGDQNVAIGNGALQISTASSNTAIGYLAGAALTTGSSNVALGVNALNDMVSGSNNTVLGKQAGDALGNEIVATDIVSGVNYTIQTTGSTDFTLIGAADSNPGTTFTATGAGTGTGTASANANYNTFVGHQAGDVIVGGSKNTIIGRFDGNQGGLDIRNSDNQIVLSDGDGNPRLYINGSGSAMVGGTVAGNAGTISLNVGNAGSTNGGLQLWGTTTGTHYVQFGDDSGTSANHYRGYMAYAHNGDSLRFGTASTERMRIDSSGNVGIGTSSPTSVIHASSASNTAINLQTSNASSSVSTNYTSANRTFYTGVDIGGANSAYTIYDGTAGSERMRIDSSGNVGIGTTSPDSTLELQNSSSLPSIALGRTPYSSHGSLTIGGTGTGHITSNTDADGNSTVNVNASRISIENGDIRFLRSPSTAAGSARTFTEYMRIDSAGRVKIGTTSNTPAGDGTPGIVFNDNTAGTPATGVASFAADGSAALLLTRLTSDGNVLGIADGTTTRGLLRVVSGNFAVQGNNNLVFSTGGSNTERMRIDSSGNVSIGGFAPKTWSLGKALHVGTVENALWGEGDYAFHMMQNVYYNSGWKYVHADEASRFALEDGKAVWATAGTGTADAALTFSERMRLTNDGLLGIGTSTPRQLLHVNQQTTTSDAIIRITNSNTPSSGGGHRVEFGDGTGTTEGSTLFRYAYIAGERSGASNDGHFIVGTKPDNSTSPREHLRVSSSGELTITGTYNSNARDDAYLIFGIKNSNGDSKKAQIHAVKTADISSELIFSTTASHTFAERMRIDDSGNLLMGTTEAFTSGGTNSGGSGAIMLARENERCLFLKRAGGNGTVVEFIRGGVTSPVGSISITTTATSYNTSSDYRLKENVVELTGATDRLKQLEPKRFNFIADADTTVDGFLAHEVQTVVPEAITGTHNEVDADGNPVYQGIDQSKLVPLLVATIKELEARITALENA